MLKIQVIGHEKTSQRPMRGIRGISLELNESVLKILVGVTHQDGDTKISLNRVKFSKNSLNSEWFTRSTVQRVPLNRVEFTVHPISTRPEWLTKSPVQRILLYRVEFAPKSHRLEWNRVLQGKEFHSSEWNFSEIPLSSSVIADFRPEDLHSVETLQNHFSLDWVVATGTNQSTLGQVFFFYRGRIRLSGE